MSRFDSTADGKEPPGRRTMSWLVQPRIWLIAGAGWSLLLLLGVFTAKGGSAPDVLPASDMKDAYVGDVACSECHREIFQNYGATAHAATSTPGVAATIHGSFERGRNELRTANPNLYFLMERKEGGSFQTAVLRTSMTEVLTRSERIDLVIGSGRKGQTYLYWDGNRLFELPVSYWARTGAWVNSPGYADGAADFERPIARRCLECHATSFISQAPPENAYLKSGLVLGIACEKCHGPGGEHVRRYRSAPPHSPADAAIVNPARLPRDRQIDVCALCHAGIGVPSTVPLSFVPGDVLARHLTFPQQPPDAHIDVHASQVELLARSRCFQASPTMTCATCHDVHRPQRDLAAFAQKCALCHKPEQCGEFKRQGATIAARCVTCHMPLEQTAQIVIARSGGGTFDPQVRNHHIAIYPSSGEP